jgi:tripartite-type tricarboxylate transporter receptor subunit TctC
MAVIARWTGAATLAIALGAWATAAGAEDFPDHPIKIIVPTSPGGSIDTTARVIGEKLQEKWGKAVVIENRPGASMQVGAEAVAKAAPDGYTLLVAHDGTMAINPLVYPNLRYDPQKSFVPLGLVVSIPEAVMVNASLPATSLAELIALAKKQPGQLTHATGGSATLLSLELFNSMAGVNIRSIQYRGAAPSVTAGIAGETSIVIADLVSAAPGLHSDRIRALAVTSLMRATLYPDLGTVDELGVKGYEVNTWSGVFAPAGTPKEIAAKIEAAIKEAVAMPDVRARFAATGGNIRSGTAEELRQIIIADSAKWAKLVQERHLTFEQQ